MKTFEKASVKDKNKAILKPFPCKFVLGQFMIDKYEDAKALSSSIKGFKKKN